MISRNKNNANLWTSLVIIVMVNIIGRCSSLCGDSFSRASAVITVGGIEQNYIADKCVRGHSLETFQLLSNTKNLLPGTFSNLYHLHTLELNSAGIETIEPGFLENTPALRKLKIERNKLESIEEYTFSELNLDTLDLSSNKISRISLDAFENSKFDYLCLSDNKLDSITPGWFRQTRITALSISHNQISSLTDRTFRGIEGLKSIKLSYNKIAQIDQNTFSRLTDLNTVYLPANRLRNVDFDISNALHYLDVSFNNISSIFLQDSTSLWSISVYPNPFDCICLQKFWEFANRKQIQLWNSKFLKQPWKDEYPICIAQKKTCNRQDQNFADVEKEYFELINYDVLGQPRYRKADDFLDLGIIN